VCAVPNSVPHRQEREGFIRTCYPAATSDSEAQPVTFTTTDPAEVEIRIRRSRYFSISGVVLDVNGQVAARATVSLVTIERNGGSSRSIQNEGGSFSVRGIAPGEYFIKAEMAQDANRSRASGYAVAHVQTTDIENLVVALAPPPIVRGHLVFEGGPPPDHRTISVQPQAARGTVSTMMGRSGERGPVKADMSFEFEGLVGPSTLRVRVPNDWVVKSVRYGGEERINIPTEFKSHLDPSALAVFLTNRPARLAARVLDERGQPVDDARVIVFPADPRQWDGSGGSSVVQFGKPAEGTYEFAGLRPAEYLVAVMPDGMFFQDDDRRQLDVLSKQAERITLLENDQKTIDLSVRR
jgi:protocatechuate 3,4-dioxygenase beta subunit